MRADRGQLQGTWLVPDLVSGTLARSRARIKGLEDESSLSVLQACQSRGTRQAQPGVLT